jgi:demethoxyubiquinone hydroxylase (CLK1/Coq7/Cat5 family)
MAMVVARHACVERHPLVSIDSLQQAQHSLAVRRIIKRFRFDHIQHSN